jgi:hypothetical protein
MEVGLCLNTRYQGVVWAAAVRVEVIGDGCDVGAPDSLSRNSVTDGLCGGDGFSATGSGDVAWRKCMRHNPRGPTLSLITAVSVHD